MQPPWKLDFPTYKTLSWEFIRLGKLEMQIDKIWDDRRKPQRVADFHAAMRDGAITLRMTPGLRVRHIKKLVSLGVDVPPELALAVLAREAPPTPDEEDRAEA